jgi:hypothetical protein
LEDTAIRHNLGSRDLALSRHQAYYDLDLNFLASKAVGNIFLFFANYLISGSL